MDKLNKNVRVGLKDTTPIKCSCGSRYFMSAMMFQSVSRLLTGEPKDSVVPVEVFLCGQCGRPCQELLPLELREQPPENIMTDIKFDLKK